MAPGSQWWNGYRADLLAAPSTTSTSPAVTECFSWIGQLGLDVDFRLDGFGLLMTLLVSGIGVAVFVYATQYFSHPGPTLGRLAGLLTLFAGSMLGLVLADNLLLLYVCWELTSVTSYLLIGFEDEKPAARAAALQAILITGVGGLAMLGGFVVLGLEADTFQMFNSRTAGRFYFEFNDHFFSGSSIGCKDRVE